MSSYSWTRLFWYYTWGYDLKIPFDLQKIPDKALSQKQKQQGRLKIISPPTPPPSPRKKSQKQSDHILSYCDRLKLLKNM